MKNIRSNIDHYMKLKKIGKYSHLLIRIAHELGIEGSKAYEFADKEKSNFSSMKAFRVLGSIKGQRKANLPKFIA